MKRETVRCKQCKRYVPDSWQKELQHAAKYHPEVLVNRMFLFIANPGTAEEFGARLAQMFNRTFQ